MCAGRRGDWVGGPVRGEVIGFALGGKAARSRHRDRGAPGSAGVAGAMIGTKYGAGALKPADGRSIDVLQTASCPRVGDR
jgi:hypothetical protein